MIPKREDSEPLFVRSANERRWLIMIQQAARPFHPPADVIELEDRLLVIVEIAGMRTSDFNITLVDRTLVISGVRERPQYPNPAYHQIEIGYGEFRLELGLPWPVERDQVSANYDAGFLQIELPRKAARHIHVVDVSSSAESTG